MDQIRYINKKLIAIAASTVIVFISLGIVLLTNAHIGVVTETPRPLPQKTTLVHPAIYTYSGVEGQTALTLLQHTFGATLDSSGLVVAINGQKAESSKHQYWAFYINGKMAQVGPADYQTHKGDTIEWKIETY